MLKQKNTLFFLALFFVYNLSGQEITDYEKDFYAYQVADNEILDIIYDLADDKMEGRATGTPGFDRAADYVKSALQKSGVKPMGDKNSYFQHYSVVTNRWSSQQVQFGNIKLSPQQFAASPTYTAEFPLFRSSRMLFVGLQSEVPKNIRDHEVVLMQVSEENELSAEDINKLRKSATEEDIDLLLLISPRFEKLHRGSQFNSGESDEKTLAQAGEASILFLSPDIAKTLLEKVQEKGKPSGSYTELSLATRLKMKRRGKSLINGKNIVGYIEGMDPQLKNEVIIITAHLDHLGIRNGEIYNGADDDGSGSSTILQMAKTYANLNKIGKGTARSLLFVWFSGEEMGLLGSKYFTANPTIDFKRAVLNLNVDMIGRNDVKHHSYDDYIYLIGIDKINPDLKPIQEEVNDRYCKLNLDYRYNEENDPNRYYYRSDHYNFAEKGIPVIFYFSGVHKDYHKPTDDPDKIDKDSLNRRARLIFYTILELGTRATYKFN